MKGNLNLASFDGKIKPLNELCDSITDCSHSTPKWTASGSLVIRNFNIKNGRLHLNDLYYTDEKSFEERIRRSKPESGDLIITREAPMGEICIIPEGLKCCLGQRMVLIKPNKKKINNKYLLYAIQSEFVQKQIKQSDKTGSIVSNLRIPVLEKLLIPSFDPIIEKNIGSVLDNIDSKIELNNRINAELEAMAKTLYDYWFVQFDFPNEQDKPYKTSGGKMVWNEELKREIPDGWKVGTLLNIADFLNGIACQNFRPQGNDFLRVIKIREMKDGFSLNSELVDPFNIPQKIIIENGDILFSWSASLEVIIWSGGKGALNQHIFKVTSKEYPKSFYYYQLLNYLQHFKMMAENRKTTMGHITQEHLQQSRIAIPPKDLTNDLDRIISPIFAKKMNNEIENQKLTELRDWLLPMLMNGQVKVGEVEEMSMAAEPEGEYGKTKKE